jgi:hypothetical protein
MVLILPQHPEIPTISHLFSKISSACYLKVLLPAPVTHFLRSKVERVEIKDLKPMNGSKMAKH